ncbi:MAG TPA: PAS domain S-box protein [Dehalococcoidia bacterium]|nr:PAS domain S-box protein [Dehalococcoidia bacterium]
MNKRSTRSQAAEAFALSEAKLASIIEHSVDAVLFIGGDREVTMFNHGAERIFGYTAEEVVGQKIEVLAPHHLRSEYVALFEASLLPNRDNQHIPMNRPVLLQRKRGEEFPAEIDIATVTIRNELVGIVQLRDVTARYQLRAALSTNQAFIELSDDAVITVDKLGNIAIFNLAAEEMFDYAAQEVIGHPYDVLIPPAYRDAYRLRFQAFLDSFETVNRMTPDSPVHMVRRNGVEFLCEIGVARLDTQGEPMLALRLRDISERLEEEELRIQLLAAEESTALKVRLISTMAHELRSPLSAILGFTSLLLEYDDQLGPEERSRQLHVIEDSMHHLQRIVDDLLALSRLESGTIEIEREPVPLKILFDSVLTSFRPQSTHIFKLTPRETQLAALGDHSRLRQVLSNLIDNALKYSPDATEIEIQARRARGIVTITVRDHGPGVPADETDLIFEPFYRSANAGRNDDTSSTGLGLAICKGLIEAHGGQIKATLPEDGGLAVTFSLPLAARTTASA